MSMPEIATTMRRTEWERGEAWQEAIVTGLMLMPDNGKRALADALGVKVDSFGKA